MRNWELRSSPSSRAGGQERPSFLSSHTDSASRFLYYPLSYPQMRITRNLQHAATEPSLNSLIHSDSLPSPVVKQPLADTAAVC